MSWALLFPGQGTHRPGMDGGLCERVPEVFAEASSIIGIDFSELCRTGRTRGADLTSTRWVQPAILTVGIASAQLIEETEPEISAVAGHSAGEYAALVVAGAVSFPDAVKLVGRRAAVMEEAAGRHPGGMVAVLGLDPELVRALSAEAGTVVAGDNAPGQMTAAGPPGALKALERAVEDAGGRCMPLNIAGAFHSPAMEAAAEKLEAAVGAADIVTPRIPFWSTTSGSPETEPGRIRRLLVSQLTSPVLFRQTVEGMWASGVRSFCDAGPGKVVATLVRRIRPDAEVACAPDLVSQEVATS